MSKYVFSAKSHRGTAHVSTCPYARIIKKDNRRFIESAELLQSSKRHLCRCCPTVIRSKYRRESAQIRTFRQENGFQISLVNERMQIISALDKWVLVPNGSGIGMRLYHENYKVHKKEWSPIPGYHLQNVSGNSVMRFLDYIHEHDQYKLKLRTDYYIDRARRSYQRTQKKSITSRHGSIETEIPVRRSGRHGAKLTRNDRCENRRFTRAQLSDYYYFSHEEDAC